MTPVETEIYISGEITLISRAVTPVETEIYISGEITLISGDMTPVGTEICISGEITLISGAIIVVAVIQILGNNLKSYLCNKQWFHISFSQEECEIN